MDGRERPPALLLRDDVFLAHEPGIGHPENPARIGAALLDLDARPVAGVTVARPRDATRTELLAVHSGAHLARVEAAAAEAERRARAGHGRPVALDPDTAVGTRSLEAALRAAGAALHAAEAVCAGEASGAFALVRPPGHHAEQDAAMGFCLFNNVAVAAAHATRHLGVARVAILDPDIHHGNGTQHRFGDRANVLFASSHRYPYYPGSGWYDEVGSGRGAGHSVNLPLPMAQGDAELLHVWERVVGPVLEQFRPELILVSAGFDTWYADPVGDLSVTESGFRALWELFRGWADAHCPGRLVGVLEGGYDPEGVRLGVRAALETLAAPRAPTATLDAVRGRNVGADARGVAERARATLAPFWAPLRG